MNNSILPKEWNPEQAANQVMENLIKVNLPEVKGAHDADFLITGNKAYIVYMANEVRPGESAEWPFVYNALSIVDIESMKVVNTITFAASEKIYDNAQLPIGACFVPRIIKKDANTLRCFFSSENPGKRQGQTWYIDFDLTKQDFIWNIYQAKIKTDQGTFPMQPQYLYQDAQTQGFNGKKVHNGIYFIDGFKCFDKQIYCVMNNYNGSQNALGVLNKEMDCFTVVGHYFQPNNANLSESAVHRLPDDTWCVISRQENNDTNYLFSTSPDGKNWSTHETWDIVPNGTCSKPNFEKFGDIYYLGWQEITRINDSFRSVFNIDVSRDCKSWKRKYHFATDNSFQYLSYHEYKGSIYLSVTQGPAKERIMFGKLEEINRMISTARETVK